MRDATSAVRSGLLGGAHEKGKRPAAGAPLHAGPVLASTFYTPGEVAGSPYTYGRFHNPTYTELEDAIWALESSGLELDGRATVFASGMAAITAVFGSVLRPGEVAVLPSDCYSTTRSAAQEYFQAMGVEVRLAETRGSAQGALLAGAKLLWLETPTNPGLDVCDIAALVEAAHAAGALVGVDNTTATAYGQQPLALGADFSVASDTKSLTGHSDVILGHVASRTKELADRIERWRTLTGGIPGPMEAWLAVRSLATLPLRLERQSQNALAIAEFLERRAEVGAVYYPGLKTHPDHALAKRQMRFFGPVVSFELKSRAAAERFFVAAELVTETTSFGGMVTTAERRARWGGDAVGEGFIRMSAGCEAIEDLLEDLDAALKAAGE